MTRAIAGDEEHDARKGMFMLGSEITHWQIASSSGFSMPVQPEAVVARSETRSRVSWRAAAAVNRANSVLSATVQQDPFRQTQVSG